MTRKTNTTHLSTLPAGWGFVAMNGGRYGAQENSRAMGRFVTLDNDGNTRVSADSRRNYGPVPVAVVFALHAKNS